jgi:hypothetical protein
MQLIPESIKNPSFHRPEFWVSVSDVPGRSFLLFEWFEPRHTETEKEFAARQKFFYLEEQLKKEITFVVQKFISSKTPFWRFQRLNVHFLKAATYRT